MKISLWNRFDRLRSKLEQQYQNIAFPADTGIVPEELRRMAQTIASQDVPLIRRRAMLMELILTQAQVHVDPDDWFADHLNAENIVLELRDCQRDKIRQELGGTEIQCWKNYDTGISFSQVDLSHTSPGWRNILSYGPAGIRDRAVKSLADAKDEDAAEFYSAVAQVYHALARYCERLADEAERCGAFHMVDALRKIAKQPPETFQEALQLAFLYHHTQEREGELVRSMGCFDRLFIDFYRRDPAAGRLTREQAKELLKFYWTKFFAESQGKLWGKNFCFGGVKEDGSDACNELTGLCFEVYYELQTVDPKLSLRVHKGLLEKFCKNCGKCIPACPVGAHRFEAGVHRFRREICTGCGQCEAACLPGALQLCGKKITLEKALELAVEDRDFYAQSGGGVTLSGGEPLLQPEFVLAFFSQLGREGIHRALDTCGEVSWQTFEKILPECDLVLYDLKHIIPESHREGTGGGNERILSNLRCLSATGIPVEVRMPLIPDYNVEPLWVRAAGEFLAALSHVPSVKLLPYHPFAAEKYQYAGWDNRLPAAKPLAQEILCRSAEILRTCGVNVCP